MQFSEKIRNFVTKSHGKIHEIKSIDEVMRQLALYIIFLMSMVFTNYGKASSVPETLSLPFAESSELFLSESSFSENQFIAGQHSENQDSKELFNKESHSEDRLTQIEHKQNKQDAQLEDASTIAYRVCSNRPQRLLPNGNIQSNPSASRLLFNKIKFLSSLLTANISGMESFRMETAPIHFDVASKYYVICLRHLRC